VADGATWVSVESFARRVSGRNCGHSGGRPAGHVFESAQFLKPGLFSYWGWKQGANNLLGWMKNMDWSFGFISN
jgi:hypothetical protein